MCSVCGKKLDVSSHLENDAVPSRGDLTICFYCGQPYTYRHNLKLEPLSVSGLAKLKREDPLCFSQYKRHLAALKQFWEDKG